jgi:hypothetical protein
LGDDTSRAAEARILVSSVVSKFLINATGRATAEVAEPRFWKIRAAAQQ